jgi:CHAT domain-containing protein
LRQALEIMERHVARISGGLSERRQMRLMASLRYLLDRYLTLALVRGMNGSNVYGHCLRWKGAAFAAASEIRVLRQNPELKSRFDELQSVSGQLATLAFRTPSPKQRDAWSRQLSDLTERKEAIEEELAKRNVEFRRQKELQQLEPAELRPHLPDRTALVDFLEFSPFRPTRTLQVAQTHERHLAVFVLGHERAVAFLDLGPVEPIRKNISTWRSTFGTSDSAVDAARALKKAIWEPLASHLRGVRTVLLSPDGDLAQFPLGALPGGKEGTYLIEEVNLVVVPVPRLLAAPIAVRDRNHDHQTAVLFGDIDFNGDPAPSRPLDSAQTLLAQATQRSTFRAGELEFPALPGTAAEIDEIAAMHAEQFGPSRQKTIRGLRATEEAVRSEAPHCAYLHLATHGFFQPVDERQKRLRDNRMAWSFQSQEQVVEIHPGLQCGLALAGANQRQAARRPANAPRDDGILTALEVASLDLRTVELVTLSACETGLGRTASGEGVLGLQRAFQIAGARNVVASLWKVDDQGTAALMRLFYYKLWAEKKSPAIALREAQLAILRNPDQTEMLATTRGPVFEKMVKLTDRQPRSSARRSASPRLWAAFILSGDWR